MPSVIEDIPESTDYMYKYRKCHDPEHDPPSMIVIPPGKRLVHTCPSCGVITTVNSSRCEY